jgi:hypothetical protein
MLRIGTHKRKLLVELACSEYRFQVYSMCMAEVCSIESVWPKDVYDVEACMPLGTGGLVYRGVSPRDMLDLTTWAASMA